MGKKRIEFIQRVQKALQEEGLEVGISRLVYPTELEECMDKVVKSLIKKLQGSAGNFEGYGCIYIENPNLQKSRDSITLKIPYNLDYVDLTVNGYRINLGFTKKVTRKKLPYVEGDFEGMGEELYNKVKKAFEKMDYEFMSWE